MCGIVGIQLRDETLYPNLGALLTPMLCHAAHRGPDSAGVGLYGDARYTRPGFSSISVLLGEVEVSQVTTALARDRDLGAVEVTAAGPTTVIRAATEPWTLERGVAEILDGTGAIIIGRGRELAVLKGTGDPSALAATFDLTRATGYQGIAHTRMATESAVTSAHSHPFSVAADLCLVHNGSFANHATIRRQLQAEGHVFDSDNDSEVGARYLAHKLSEGSDLEKALRQLCDEFDGFYTLLVTTADSFAVVRDAIACKPAVIAQTDSWVAMASEYRSLAGLPGIDQARLFEPEPEEVYLWQR
ncbi:hypothetical protein M6D93_14265 [Jatrophihabitans telluris]|uniref:Glutamine amidotransferase type-2 domain-containing protein n=1 Tax=Jatrophihabitans telluris TaxID=2038343 RepID=A0ABY4QVD9_9ACTN|nr:hypothetical protein [Jatrophihabitans telluris]UQX87460.1 hypothetical protein M6D93_14265 [Jatrophihabitans telluris]